MRNIYFWAALVWTTTILVCCLISMRNFDAVPLAGDYTDKYVHFSFYFGFTLLWYFACSLKYAGRNLKLRLQIFLAAVVLGIIIEICQEFFTKDRSADITDVMANTSGSAIAVLILWIAGSIKKKQTLNPE